MSDWHQDNERIIAHFNALLRQHGQNVSALDWGSQASQELRFAVLAGIGIRSGESLLDVGCGLAHLNDYLQRQGIVVHYIGCDLAPAMIEQARARVPGISVEIRDILAGPEPRPAYDWVVASGVFYLCREAPMQFMDRFLRRMFALCKRGVAFNSLSTQASERDAGEFYADPVEVLRLCLSISPRALLRHDYMAHDFTVYLYRGDQP